MKIKRHEMLMLAAACTLFIGTAYVSLSIVKSRCHFAGDEGASSSSRVEAQSACYAKYWYIV